MILARMSLFKKITESGVTRGDSIQKKRAIILSNYIALVLFLSCFLIFIIIPQNHNWSGFAEMAIGAILFSFTIVLNYFSFTHISRLYLCWLPPILIIWYTGLSLGDLNAVPVSAYDGLRFYLLAFGCIPYLVMNRNNPLLFIAGVIPGLTCIIFCDFFLDLVEVGYSIKGIADSGYWLTPIRVFVAYLIISTSSLSLNFIIAKSDELNQKLLVELAGKNRLIKEQAENEVLQLNDQLRLNLKQLSEREFFLNQSQRIAKIGSWEYYIEDNFLFWSDEMYSIFGLDRSYNLSRNNLSEAIGKEGNERLIDANIALLRTGKPYDITIRTKTPIGYTKWFRVYAYPILEGPNAIGIRGICHDITIFKESEEKLRAGENKFSKVFANYPDFIMVVRESDLLVVDVNPKIENMLGFKKEEVIGRSARAMELFLSEDERQSFIQNFAHDGYIKYDCQWKRKDGGIIDVKITGIRLDIDGQHYRMSVVRDITKEKQAEKERERARYLLNERMKELTALYHISQILHTDQKTLNEMIWEIVSILPSGWQYPEIAVCRIVLGEDEFIDPNFVNAKHKQHAKFSIPPNSTGLIEVAYTEDKPTESEGPFVAEERNLINMLAAMLEEHLARKYEQESLTNAQANLKATINNTEVLIWSVDRQYRLIMFNIPFYDYIKNNYNVEIEVGKKVLDPDHGIQKWWEQNYLKSLSGEIVNVEETRFGLDIQYSLSPIIEDNMITGVSVFADNVTERKTKDRELTDANKKVTELRLMALRSAMSPHFIFNALNSIQFFIAKNDRLNAIKYLSTFSKLIRSILTHSVTNKIKLSEEIEMLNNYVSLEMSRFEDKFDFKLSIDPSLDVDSIEIPSLLIQPYVENAILHGLYNKKERGLLYVEVTQVEDHLMFEITDNGIGREAAQRLNQNKIGGHQSIGLKLTEERLKLINDSPLTVFEIEDLRDQNGGCGTRVKIRIAIKN